ncbi:Proline-rich AKT1 substrate 1 [Rhizophlyctis rosea]|nr:Proline-rich AKT1 substrate 1 [Rhizophlyctis rosea]
MQPYCCPCLNVKVTPSTPPSSSASAEDGSDTQVVAGQPLVQKAPGVEGVEIKLGLGGITLEHPVLTKAVRKSDDWTEVICLNCDSTVYFCEGDGSPLQPLFPTTETVLISNKVIYGEAADNAKASPKFSPSLKILLFNQTHVTENDEASELRRKFPNVQSDVEHSLTLYLALAKAEMEQRIAAVRAEEQARFEQLERRAREDVENVWARVKEVSEEGKLVLEAPERAPSPEPVEVPSPSIVRPPSTVAGGLSTSFAGPASLKSASFLQGGSWDVLGTTPIIRNRRTSLAAASSFNAPATSLPQVPEATTNGGLATHEDLSESKSAAVDTQDEGTHERHSTGAESHSSGKRVHFAGVEDEKEDGATDGKGDQRSDDDDVFELDMDDTIPGAPKRPSAYDLDSASESEPEDEDDGDAAPMPATELLSTSVPISIPRCLKGMLATRTPDLSPDNDDQPPDEDMMEERDMEDEDAFVAPHILSARTYTEDDVLKRYRPTRKLSTSYNAMI